MKKSMIPWPYPPTKTVHVMVENALLPPTGSLSPTSYSAYSASCKIPHFSRPALLRFQLTFHLLDPGPQMAHYYTTTNRTCSLCSTALCFLSSKTLTPNARRKELLAIIRQLCSPSIEEAHKTAPTCVSLPRLFCHFLYRSPVSPGFRLRKRTTSTP